jgi:hypothetical protein
MVTVALPLFKHKPLPHTRKSNKTVSSRLFSNPDSYFFNSK